MEKQEIYSHVDHTQLKAVSTWQDIRKLCEEALAHHTASVCIPPSYVARAHEHFPALNICTVIGFPLGYNTTAVKVFEPSRPSPRAPARWTWWSTWRREKRRL